MRLPFAYGRQAVVAALLACVAVAALARLPFVHAGLGMDEGGYAYVAERWAGGARLYQGAWVDRPQGLLLVYRLVLEFGHSAFAIRLAALLCGCLLTALVGSIGWMLRGPAAGIAAAAIDAVVGVGPHIEGFTFNAELIGAVPSAAAIAAALRWRQAGGARWLLVAGLAAGSAPLMKQSCFDGLLVAAAIVLSRAGTRRRRTAHVGVFLAAAALPLGAAAVDGLLLGWHRYWLAVAGYKLAASSGGGAAFAARLARLMPSIHVAARDLAVVAVVAVVGVTLALTRRPRSSIPALWLLAAFAGFNVGASYWPHYYVQLVPPLALAAGITAAQLRRAVAKALIVAICTFPVATFVANLPLLSDSARDHAVAYESLYEQDERVAAAVRADSRPTQTIYVLDSRADVYLLAHRTSPYPYLWAHPLHEIPGALARLRSLLSAPQRPTLVIVYTPPDQVDPSGRLEHTLTTHYRPDGRIAGTPVTLLRADQLRCAC